MITSALIGLLSGLLIGRRFKVLALLPAMLAGVVVFAVLAAAHVLAPGEAALAALALVLGQQAGYAAMIVLGSAFGRRTPERSLST